MGFAEILDSIDWEHESYPAYEDYIVLEALAFFFPTVRFFLDRFVFEVRSLLLMNLLALSLIIRCGGYPPPNSNQRRRSEIVDGVSVEGCPLSSSLPR
ncbi:hypothetical protein LINPERPRIM_LOCUS24952 [Linum perenne]